ncbi:MAG: hypothetical protein V3W11_11130 [bacterium]
MVNAPRYFVYKMTTDNGGAPSVANGLLSLAICKPVIRSSAEICDWIFGFGGEDLGARLIYIAEVNYKLSNGAYYRSRKYAKRPDCIYKYGVKENGFVRKRTALYHEGTKNLKKDIGEHHDYRNANVLLSCNFRYLGDEGKTLGDMKDEYPLLRKLLSSLKQGHLVNHDAKIVKELDELRNEVWDKYVCKVVGTPSDKDPSKRCSDDCGSVEVRC